MAYVALGGFDVEAASNKLVYENLMPEIMHINGKGVTDKYTKTNDIASVHSIDIMRVLPYLPTYRQLGASVNGKWFNEDNANGNKNTPQSESYSIPVDIFFDRGIPLYSTQSYSNPIALQQIITSSLVKTMGLVINIATFAKQLIAFFTDSFTPTTSTEEELAHAVFAANAATPASADGSYTDAFIKANAELSEGIPEIGAFIVPADERQAFVTNKFNAIMKRQYMQNASDVAARILANGFINPFTNTEDKRINANTGLAGMYDGVDIFTVNNVIKKFVYVSMGLGSKAPELALMDKLQGFIVYGAGTCRGIAGPYVEVNKQVTQQGVFVAPYLKMGVEVLSGKTIKCIVDGGWQTTDVDKIRKAVSFTPINDTNGANVFAQGTFNDGTGFKA